MMIGLYLAFPLLNLEVQMLHPGRASRAKSVLQHAAEASNSDDSDDKRTGAFDGRVSTCLL